MAKRINATILSELMFSIIFILLIPLLIWLFLSITKIYFLSIESNYRNEFTTAYINLNLNYAYFLLSLTTLIRSFSKKIFKYSTTILFLLIIIIRSLDLGLKENFGISYSTFIFKNLALDSLLFFLKNYFFHLIITIAVGLFFAALFNFLINFFFGKLKKRALVTCIFIVFLLGARSTYILYKEKLYSFEVISEFALIKEIYEYQDFSNSPKIILTNEESSNLKKVGVFPTLWVDKESQNKINKKNLVILYLESFSSNYIKIGGSNYENLTPNLDEFAEDAVYFPNYRSSAPGTHESMISSFCGIYSMVGPEYIRYNPEYTRGLNCLFEILRKFNYQQFFYVGHHLGYSGLNQFFNRSSVKIIDSSYFETNHPQWLTKGHEWGIQDTDLAKFLVETLPKEISIERPYFLGSFFINTHGPFFTAEDCERYGNDNDAHLNAIHCVDQAFGIFWKGLLKTGLLDNSVIMVLGDTPGVNLKTRKGEPYGNPLMLISDPDSSSTISSISFHTPDVGATLLELIGFDIQSLNFGHSILSSRKSFPILFGPTYRIDNENNLKKSNCSYDEFLETKLERLEITSDSCQHNKLLKYTHEWVVEQDMQIKLQF